MTSQDAFDTHFATLQLDERTLQISHDQTIVPESMRGMPEKVDALRTLPRLSTTDVGGLMADLQVVGTLGEGGMGLVRLARQVALDREVAVKTLRSHTDDSAPKLLQEAYATGRLEHPNIIPVYTLGRDDDGAPLIVMKRVEGVSWLDVMRDPALVPDGTAVDVVWHLEILLQVCNALRYAHSHHVLHRDIKPENVMIGRFGEVYLLDWGIAISVAPSMSGPLPHRDTVVGLSGTPAYMAPEMTDNSALAQDERTDVYLLGAVLHEVLTGTPPHWGATLFDVMRSAFENVPPQYEDTVPTELATIATRAMATNKEERFASVDEFRAAVSDYLEHRGASELVDEARALLRSIEELPTDGGAEVERHDLYTQCRFACRQALRAWPQGEAVRATYTRYLELLFHDCVRRKEAVQAESTLGELEEFGFAVEPLRELLSSLSADIDSERREFDGLRALAADADMSLGRFSRSIAVMGMGILWSIHTIYLALQRGTGDAADDVAAYIRGSFVVAGVALLGVVLGRRTLFSNAANRRLAYLFILIAVNVLVFRFAFWLNPNDLILARSLETATYAVFGVAGGMLSDDLRIAAAATIYFGVAMLDAIYGTQFGWVLGVTHLAFFTLVAWLWTPAQLEKRIRV